MNGTWTETINVLAINRKEIISETRLRVLNLLLLPLHAVLVAIISLGLCSGDNLDTARLGVVRKGVQRDGVSRGDTRSVDTGCGVAVTRGECDG